MILSFRWYTIVDELFRTRDLKLTQGRFLADGTGNVHNQTWIVRFDKLHRARTQHTQVPMKTHIGPNSIDGPVLLLTEKTSFASINATHEEFLMVRSS